MIILVSGGTAAMRKFHGHDRLGVLFVPNSGNRANALWPDAVWAADNGAFIQFDAAAFVGMLEDLRDLPGCLFVAAPDVVGKHLATLRLFRLWEPMIRSLGFPVALVGQNGLTVPEVPWADLDAFFIGGSLECQPCGYVRPSGDLSTEDCPTCGAALTEWKLSREAATLAGYAKAKGKWVHMGRVNSRQRIHYAERIGCDSVDGTCFSRWSNLYIAKGIDWTAPLPLFSAAHKDTQA